MSTTKFHARRVGRCRVSASASDIRLCEKIAKERLIKLCIVTTGCGQERELRCVSEAYTNDPEFAAAAGEVLYVSEAGI